MAPANETPSTLTRFIGEHFAMVVGGGLVAILTATAFIGPRPPTQPKELAVLSPDEHKRIVADVASAMAGEVDAGGSRAMVFTDFLGLPNMVKLPLYANFLSYAQSSDSGPKKPVDRRDVLIVDGAVRQAYLLVHVARPLQTWEKVYVTVDERGGHLHGAEGLRAPVDPRSTTQLYDFHMVPHDVYGVAEPPSDWFSRLKPGARPIVHSFLSSTQPGLLDLSVFYECVEPGKCSIVHEGIR